MSRPTHLANALPPPSTISDSAEIRETCALLARCDLFIGNDTGAAHLAAAMQLPDHRHLPPSRKRRPKASQQPGAIRSLVRSRLACFSPSVDSTTATRVAIQSGPHCIEQISVPEVVAAAKTMLMQSSRVRDKLKASPML